MSIQQAEKDGYAPIGVIAESLVEVVRPMKEGHLTLIQNRRSGRFRYRVRYESGYAVAWRDER